MGLQILMVCADPSLAAAAAEAARKANLESDLIESSEIAATMLDAYPYDGLLLDYGMAPGVIDLLQAVRRSDRQKVVIAVIEAWHTVREACDLGATFVMRKPVSAEALHHTLHAAYGMMLSGKRRHWRCPVAAPVEGATRDGVQILGKTVNLSMEGMLLQTGATLRSGVELDFKIHLADLAEPLAVSGRVAWAEQGRIGIQFGNLPSKSREALANWMTIAVQQLG